jgi:hypothetical protein
VVTCGYMGGALWPDTAQRIGKVQGRFREGSGKVQAHSGPTRRSASASRAAASGSWVSLRKTYEKSARRHKPTLPRGNADHHLGVCELERDLAVRVRVHCASARRAVLSQCHMRRVREPLHVGTSVEEYLAPDRGRGGWQLEPAEGDHVARHRLEPLVHNHLACVRLSH